MTDIPPIDWGPWITPDGRGRPYTCKVGCLHTISTSHWLTELGVHTTTYRYEVVCNYRSILSRTLLIPCCGALDVCPISREAAPHIPCRDLLREAAKVAANGEWVQLVQAMIQSSTKEEET